MKYFTSIVVVAALFVLVGQAGAAPVFSGDTFPWFGTPPNDGGTYELHNGTYPTDLSSTLFSGVPEDGSASRNEYTLTGLPGFSTPADTPFAVADLFYHNGRTIAVTTESSVPVNLDIYFSDPAGVDRTFSFSFDLILTRNTDDPVESADRLIPVDVFSTTTFIAGPEKYTLELLGFSNDGGTTMAAEFVLFEDADTTSTLYGRIVPPPPGKGPAGEEPSPLPEPTALGLIGMAVLALRKRRA
ncbi:MAG: choice-of-anchor K domain-containing protein [Planctomycetota bacterium]